MDWEAYLANKLNKRKQLNTLRSLNPLPVDGVDFCSNDYLGLAQKTEHSASNLPMGSGGSRLIAGTHPVMLDAEKKIAAWHRAKSTLLFNSGYAANLGVFATLPSKDCVILFDQAIHASIKDGMRLSFAKKISFKHNDLNHLAKLLQKHVHQSTIFIAVESVYSMGGDCAPLEAMCLLAKQFNAVLIVDEAHALGVFGVNGLGLCEALNCESQVPIRIITYGKAMGAHGAAVLCTPLVKEYLINFAHAFIYTTALAPHSVGVLLGNYPLMQSFTLRQQLKDNIEYFKLLFSSCKFPVLLNDSAIQGIIINDVVLLKKLITHLNHKGFNLKAVVSPTVPHGNERIRICLHSFNTQTEINMLFQAIQTF